MREEDFETAIKVVVVGNGAVGKSSMIQRYCKGTFTQEYKKTIGVDFLERQIEVNGEDVRLMLWDTAGQEEFDAITKAYYRGAQACVLVFSTLDRDSFKAIESWKKKVEAECSGVPMALVQNKIDMVDRTVVTAEEAEQLAQRLKLRFFRTSVKEDHNVSEVFRYLASRYMQHLASEPIEQPANDRSGREDHHRSVTGVLKSPSRTTTNGNISLHSGHPTKKHKKSGFGKNCRLL